MVADDRWDELFEMASKDVHPDTFTTEERIVYREIRETLDVIDESWTMRIPRHVLIEVRRNERERCAQIADVIARDSTLQYSDNMRQQQAQMTAEQVARSIRYAEDN